MGQHLAAQPVRALAVCASAPRPAPFRAVWAQVLEDQHLPPGGDRRGDDGRGDLPRHRRIQPRDVPPQAPIAALALDGAAVSLLPPRDLLQHLLPLGVLAPVPERADTPATRAFPGGSLRRVRVEIDGADLQIRLRQAPVFGLTHDGGTLLARVCAATNRRASKPALAMAPPTPRASARRQLQTGAHGGHLAQGLHAPMAGRGSGPSAGPERLPPSEPRGPPGQRGMCGKAWPLGCRGVVLPGGVRDGGPGRPAALRRVPSRPGAVEPPCRPRRRIRRRR